MTINEVGRIIKAMPDQYRVYVKFADIKRAINSNLSRETATAFFKNMAMQRLEFEQSKVRIDGFFSG